MLFPGATPQSNNGRLLSSSGSEIRGHAKRERAKEVPSDASEPMGADDAGDAGCVPGVGSGLVAGDAAATVAATAGSWVAAATAARTGLHAIAR